MPIKKILRDIETSQGNNEALNKVTEYIQHYLTTLTTHENTHSLMEELKFLENFITSLRELLEKERIIGCSNIEDIFNLFGKNTNDIANNEKIDAIMQMITRSFMNEHSLAADPDGPVAYGSVFPNLSTRFHILTILDPTLSPAKFLARYLTEGHRVTGSYHDDHSLNTLQLNDCLLFMMRGTNEDLTDPKLLALIAHMINTWRKTKNPEGIPKLATVIPNIPALKLLMKLPGIYGTETPENFMNEINTYCKGTGIGLEDMFKKLNWSAPTEKALTFQFNIIKNLDRTPLRAHLPGIGWYVDPKKNYNRLCNLLTLINEPAFAKLKNVGPNNLAALISYLILHRSNNLLIACKNLSELINQPQAPSEDDIAQILPGCTTEGLYDYDDGLAVAASLKKTALERLSTGVQRAKAWPKITSFFSATTPNPPLFEQPDVLKAVGQRLLGVLENNRCPTVADNPAGHTALKSG